MTKEDIVELYNKKLHNTYVQFSFYYKYQFQFNGSYEGYNFSLTMGGDSDEIYKEEVDNQMFKLSNTFDSLLNQYNFIIITNDETKESFEWDNLQYMTYLQQKNIIVQANFIRDKEIQLKGLLKELTKAPKTEEELDDIEQFIRINNLEKYV